MSTVSSSSAPVITIPDHFRHIKIFTTPAGTPSSSRKDTRPSNWARWFPSTVQHWGLFLESQSDGFTGGTFFELAFPGGNLGIIKRSRSQREKEEKNNGKWIKWEDTYHLTEWTDKQIEFAANRLCRDELQGTYDVRNRNCQTFANLLIQMITYGSEQYIPRHTASHAFGNGPSDEHLSVTHPADRAKSAPFKGNRTFQVPDWNAIGRSHEHLLKAKERIQVPVDAQRYIDLDEGQRPEGPGTIDKRREVALAYARGKSGAPKPEWAEPPPFSVGMPDETRRALEAQTREQQSQGTFASDPSRARLIGPRTAFVQRTADNLEDSFRTQIEAARARNERAAEFEKWNASGNLSDAEKRRKWEELCRLESGLLMGDSSRRREDFKKDQEFYSSARDRR